MFNNKQDNVNPSSADSSQNQYIRTMKDDLASGSGTFFAKETEVSQASTEKNNANPFASATPAQEAAPTAPLSENSPFASSAFSAPAPSEAAKPQPTPAEPTQQAQSFSQREEAIKIADPDYTPKSSINGKKIFLIVLFIVIILALTGGGYFFWLTRSSESVQPTVQPAAETPVTENEPVTISPLSEKFSLQNPNFLSIDTNIATVVDIQNLLTTTSKEIEQLNPATPVEFVLTDLNNSPVAFHIFVALAKIDLPSTLLSSFEEYFSLYFYPDNGKVHIGIQIASPNKEITSAEMKATETKLATALQLLLMDATPRTQTPAFNDGTYNGQAVRYSNLDPENNLSIDYAVSAKSLFIGTSKNTLRAIIDKNAAKEAAQTPIENPASEVQTTTEPTSAN